MKGKVSMATERKMTPVKDSEIGTMIIVGACIVALAVFLGLALTKGVRNPTGESAEYWEQQYREEMKSAQNRILLNQSTMLVDASKAKDTALLLEACGQMCTEQEKKPNRTASFEGLGIDCDCVSGAEAEVGKVENLSFSDMQISMGSGTTAPAISVGSHPPSTRDCRGTSPTYSLGATLPYWEGDARLRSR